MLKIPRQVTKAFDDIRKKYPSYTVLKRINGQYYVYSQKGMWLKEERKTKTISEYLGRITDEGLFIRKKLSAKDDLENAKAIIAERGGEIVWHAKPGSEEAENVQQEVTAEKLDLRILTALSMNARMSSSKLAKLAGIGSQVAYRRVKALEKKFGIRYILETDMEKLGFLQYLILIKFEGEKPSIEELRRTFEDEYRIQFAATTTGEYDVVMFFIDENPLKADDDLRELRYREPLNKYKAFWYMVYFAQVFSFMPLRDLFIEHVLKERVWHRTKENPKIDKNQLRYREFLILKELNSNSVGDLSDIDEKHKLSKGTSRYTYNLLKARGIIVRPTITLTNLGLKYIGLILISNLDYKKIEENRYKSLLDILEYGKVVNRYSLSGNVGSPTGAIRFLPVTEDGYIDKIVANVERELQGSMVRSLIITDVIVGSLCYRRFDNTYSRQYRTLVEMKKIEPKGLEVYD